MADSRSARLAAQPEPTAGARDGEGLSLGRQLLRPRTLLSFGISLAIIVWIFARQNIPVAEVWENMRSANPALYALGFLAYYSTFAVRSLRWKQVLHNAGYGHGAEARLPRDRTLTRIIFLSWFANSVLPAKLGDGYRGLLLKRNAPVSFAKTMGTILAERIADVGMLFTLLLASGLLAFRNQLPPNFGLLIGFGAALAVLSLVALLGLRYVGPIFARFLPRRIRPYYARLEAGVLLAFRARVGLILLLTVSVWLLESARFWFVAASLGLQFSLPLVVFIALAASLLTTVPFTPAGLGVVESAVVTVLLSSGVVESGALAASVALLDRTITYWSVVLIGAVVYLVSNNK